METRTSKRYTTVYMVSLFTLFIVNTMVRSKWESGLFIGEVSLYATFVFMYFFLLKSSLTSNLQGAGYRPVYVMIGLLMLYISSHFVFTTFMVLPEYVTLLLHLLFIAASVRIPFKSWHLKVAGSLFSLVMLLLFFDWIRIGMPLQGFKSIFQNENYVAVLLFSFLYFQVIAQHYSRRIIRSLFRLAIVLTLFLIVLTGARSVIIGIAMILLTALCIKYFPLVLNYLLSIVLLGSLLFVGLYVGLSHTAIGNKLNTLTFDLTGKNLFSGRSEIWEAVLQAILHKPMIGHGLGVQASDVAEISFTAHNMYLQVMLEFGLFGFVLFYLLLASIWRLLLKNRTSFAAQCSLSFMIGIIVYNSFELTLFQNNYSIAVLQWLIMAAGIGFLQKERSLNKGNIHHNQRRLQ